MTLAAPSDAREESAAWDRAVQIWLAAVAALVLAMVTVGGATRLTDSGLSITEWKPIIGAIPPLSDADWHDAFQKYRQIPEFHHVNPDMTLEGFKFIFWWEWAHRFLGRFIGVAFAVPLLAFWALGALRPGMGKRLAGILALGAVQGGIGWYMVSSGLVDRVDVSQYRLALHLGVAFLIFAALLWTALDLNPEGAREEVPRLTTAQRRMAPALVALLLMQVVLGAFVAGLKAGPAYPTWPTMNGEMVPEGLFRIEPWWRNFFENETLVQFDHRLFGYAVLALALVQAVSLWRSPEAGRATTSAMVAAGAVLAQVAIGIATLLHAVPLSLGLLHQAMAVLVLAAALWHWHRVRRWSA